jgi:hypothetical protein
MKTSFEYLPKTIRVIGDYQGKWPNFSGIKLNNKLVFRDYSEKYTFNNLENKNLMFHLELVGSRKLENFQIIKTEITTTNK